MWKYRSDMEAGKYRRGTSMRKAMMVFSLTLPSCFYFYIDRQDVDIKNVRYDG